MAYLEGRGEVELCLEPLLWEVCSTDLQGGEQRGEMVVTCMVECLGRLGEVRSRLCGDLFRGTNCRWEEQEYSLKIPSEYNVSINAS